MKKIFFSFLLLIPVLVKGQIITTVAGTGTKGYSGDNGPATNSKLNTPTRICHDNLGNIIFSDQLNYVARKVSTSGVITTIAGNGTGGYAGDNGPATAATLSNPSGIDFDTAGNLYISDVSNYVIRKINKSGIISTIIGVGTRGFSGDNGPATSAQLGAVFGIKVDSYGNIYLADYGNARIRKVDTAGIISTIGGNGLWGFSGDGGPATDARLDMLGGIAVSRTGDIYFTDGNNYRIRKIGVDGTITTFAGGGTLFGRSSDNHLATAAGLPYPGGVFVDDVHKYVYLTSDNMIRRVDSNGIITTAAGNSVEGYSGDNGPATDAQLNSPIDITINKIGEVFIIDQNNHCIRKFTDRPWEVRTDVINLSQDVSIYPNPAHTSITIKAMQIQDIAIVDMAGEIIYKREFTNANHSEIDISRYATGTYFVKVNAMYAGRFVKD